MDETIKREAFEAPRQRLALLKSREDIEVLGVAGVKPGHVQDWMGQYPGLVGGIEATSVLVGEPVSLLSPRILGVRLTGSLPTGVMTPDLALSLTHFLRSVGVVGAMVEFTGLGALGVPGRASA